MCRPVTCFTRRVCLIIFLMQVSCATQPILANVPLLVLRPISHQMRHTTAEYNVRSYGVFIKELVVNYLYRADNLFRLQAASYSLFLQRFDLVTNIITNGHGRGGCR
mgnify:CR=1 FL=1